jgi:alkaline phosphatase D
MWKYIIQNKPQLWIWLGDNIYAETDNMDEMERMYNRQKINPNYKKLLEFCPVIGTWDDHDYGKNNIGKNFPEKKNAQQLHLDFFNVPKDSPRRKQEGIYSAFDLGEGNKSIKLIFLDTRYFRDDPSPDGDILGENQWKWFENTLKENQASITIIGTSVQFAAAEHPFEEWLHFPKSYERMKKTIAQSGKKHVFFISGDRHISEINKISEGLPYPLYDFTSSGLTHSHFTYKDDGNKNRVSPLCISQNFGIIEIDWDNQKIYLESRGKGNFLYYKYEIPFKELE